MKMQQLQCFREVAYAGSFSKAAKVLYLSQSTVSYHIQALEQELGVRLLNREFQRNSVTLSEAGKTFLPYAEQAISLNRECIRFFRQIGSADREKIHIACSERLTSDLIPFLIREAETGFHTGRALHLEIKTADRMVDIEPLLLAGEVDLAIFPDRTSERLSSRMLGAVPLLLYIPVNHPAAYMPKARLQDLADLPLAMPVTETSDFYRKVQSIIQYEGYAPVRSPYSSDNPEERFFGVSLLQCYTISADTHTELRDIMRIPLDSPYASQNLYAAWNPQRELRDMESILLDRCGAYLRASRM